MIVLSLALVIAAAVALFIGLFVTTGLTFIYIAIGLCLVSLLLLWFGTRSRKAESPSAPSPPVYGGVRPGTTAAPVRRATVSDDDEEPDEARDVDELDELTAPEGDVVRAPSARDRAATRVAEAASETQGDSAGEEPSVQVVDAAETTGTAASSTGKKATAKKSAATRSTAKKSAAKKSTAKKSTAKKSTAKKSTAKKATAGRSATSGTRGKAARERLAEIPGVGPAKQEALLKHYGSLEAIRDASVDDIVTNVRGVGQALATRVKDAL